MAREAAQGSPKSAARLPVCGRCLVHGADGSTLGSDSIARQGNARHDVITSGAHQKTLTPQPRQFATGDSHRSQVAERDGGPEHDDLVALVAVDLIALSCELGR